jgi:hypothetical protein
MRVDSQRALRFVPAMRLLFFLAACVATAGAEVPAALDAALKTFRADGAPGWSFTQSTVAGDESLVERFDAPRPDFERWSLLEKNGRPATADERRDYAEKQTRRSRGGTAPKITDSLDLASTEVIAETAERTTYRCRLKKPEAGDRTADFLRATLVLHQPTRTIESFELGSTGPFSPALGIRIQEMKTVMRFSLPTAERPSLLLAVTTHLRGRAFFIKSLDQDMTVTRIDYAKAFATR